MVENHNKETEKANKELNKCWVEISQLTESLQSAIGVIQCSKPRTDLEVV